MILTKLIVLNHFKFMFRVGIVPVDHPVEEIRGAAVFIESSDIAT
jgi:hypothetical protein